MADSSEQQSQLCIGGCGFFGHPSFGNYCSVCFKGKHGSATPVPLSPATPIATSAPSLSMASDSATSSASDGAPASTMTPAETAAATKPIQKNVQKCWHCNKRVGLLGFKCKCEYVFCSNHRLSQSHQCIVDYQTLAREELGTRLGDAIVPKKLERL